MSLCALLPPRWLSVLPSRQGPDSQLCPFLLPTGGQEHRSVFMSDVSSIHPQVWMGVASVFSAPATRLFLNV